MTSSAFVHLSIIWLSLLTNFQNGDRAENASIVGVDALSVSETTIWENSNGRMVESTIQRNKHKLTQIRTVFDCDGSPVQRTTQLKCGDFGGWNWVRKYSEKEVSFVDVKSSCVVGLFFSAEPPIGKLDYICDASNKDILAKFSNSTVQFKIIDSGDYLRFGKSLPWETRDCLVPIELYDAAIQVDAREVQSYSRNNIVVFRKYVSDAKDSFVTSWYDFYDRNYERNAVFLVLQNGSKVLLIKSKTTWFSLLDVDSDGAIDLMEFTFDRLNKEVEVLQFYNDKIDVVSTELREKLSSSDNFVLRELVEKLPSDK